MLLLYAFTLQEKELGRHSVAQLDVNATPVVEYHLPARLQLPPHGMCANLSFS